MTAAMFQFGFLDLTRIRLWASYYVLVLVFTLGCATEGRRGEGDESFDAWLETDVDVAVGHDSRGQMDSGAWDEFAGDEGVVSPTQWNIGTYSEEVERNFGGKLTVQVWYPTLDESMARIRYGSLLPGEAIEEAVPNCDETRRVFLFSHGNGGIRWQSAFLMEALAKAGYIGVAMDHNFNTFLDEQPNLLPQVALSRPGDVSAAFDWLKSEAESPDGRFFGCIDSSQGFAVGGHSFGGYTAYMTAGATLRLDELDSLCRQSGLTACSIAAQWRSEVTRQGDIVDLSDPRVWAVVTLAPWNVFGVLNRGMSDLTLPVLTLTGTLDEITDTEMVDRLVMQIASEESSYAYLNDAGHYTFSPVACRLLSGDGCGDNFLALELAEPVISETVRRFLDAYSTGVEFLQEPSFEGLLDWR